ncbi:MAG: phosphoribosyl-AMP cyclohydrolase [Candidatus Alkanophagales archaeon]|nr:MAG: phosphoribosyl-AMP cyclohydrolase [Candidatus Alkanophagales archaeon]
MAEKEPERKIELRWEREREGEDLLIHAIAQDYKTGEVLMLAHMNREALEKTLETGVAHYWSRSRKKLWKKGETSGHLQIVREILVDCDGDALLLKVEQVGGACHTGYRSCFFRTLNGKVVGKKVFEPEEKYGTGRGGVRRRAAGQ